MTRQQHKRTDQGRCNVFIVRHKVENGVFLETSQVGVALPEL